MGQGPCGRAMSERREFCRRDVGPRVIGRLHMWCDHAKRAGVEHPRHLGEPWHANERRDPGFERGDADLAGGLERETGMLQIDIEAVEARTLCDARDLDAAHQPDRHRGDDVAAAQPLLDMVAQ